MARTFVLPDLGEGLIEAEIRAVLVHEGDVVKEDSPLIEVETDKAQVEIPSPFGGRVEKIHVHPGQTVKVGEPLVSFADAVGAAPPARSAPAAAAPVAPAAQPAVAPRGDGGPVAAAPSTRRLARELSVDLQAVRGTGSGGRITDDDVRAGAGKPPSVSKTPDAPAAPARAAAPAGPAKPLAAVGLEPPPLPEFEQWGPVERQPLSHLRRTIAERMALSAALIPHVSHFDKADVTDLNAIVTRSFEAAKQRGITLTLTSFLLKAAALALHEHPQFNASLDAGAGELILKRYCHLGIAVATDRGLIVPVIHDVDTKPVMDIARELAALAQRVRDGKAALDDLRGGTFTITNLGALGGTGAIPIINYPEVAILAVARGREEPVVRGGQILVRMMLPITLTFDHRVADGADGARFAQAIIRRLEAPETLFVGW
ncbi:MAG: 2-oxo acid dehydrogenase subunit E2 [Candidatus Rokubacteria bacterium]|nr:2-oxo acid dehydrogenase subunit E2 [Candidatus Rokubacteria bacterium]